MCYKYDIRQHIFGGENREETGVDPHRWIGGQASRKCLLHAIEIQQLAAQMPLGVAHDEQLPGALFAIATTYSSFALAGKPKVIIPSSTDWDTLLFSELEEVPSRREMAGGNTNMNNTIRFLGGEENVLEADCEARNLLYELGSIRILLRGLSYQWGVAQEMEEVVGAWIMRCE
ncbi:hypothetical protein N7510_007836 [Penicillium lagena]|uniref:uncharacterized protein n=1 Tax=Penicillium lagena TaxID=94218 RepID=UPI0025417759|nr:uncharacterized protein N7510_007836 [Penicillium lagena]KAJ5611117.1 hypothetical protein N7510_007836 [Penicillium lagena]